MDTTQKFTGRAVDYVKGRPAYAEAFLQSLAEDHGFSPGAEAADIGCGTGKFSAQLLEKGFRVYGVEPNDDMRGQAESALGAWPGFRAVKGTAADTTLADASMDLVTCAQAFHWFDPEAFSAECRRILRPRGKVFLIWNMREESAGINREMYELYKSFCPAFRGFAGGIQKDDGKIRRFFSSGYQYQEYENPLFYTMETFISRSLSGSYSLKEGDPGFQEYLGGIREVFGKYENHDLVEMPNKTVVYFGTMIFPEKGI